jgi:hypothetical protein
MKHVFMHTSLLIIKSPLKVVHHEYEQPPLDEHLDVHAYSVHHQSIHQTFY